MSIFKKTLLIQGNQRIRTLLSRGGGKIGRPSRDDLKVPNTFEKTPPGGSESARINFFYERTEENLRESEKTKEVGKKEEVYSGEKEASKEKNP